ncbi:MAG: hypothetical protein DHS20C20_20820 [Ardenticatenaceae bacterium]|nr:MAG: hypothetical protein DHS20C20_20820 [Ardenticatenaceae bacterium]
MNKSLPFQTQPILKKNVFLLLWLGINVAGWAALTSFVSGVGVFQSSNFLSFLGFSIIGGGMSFLQWLLLRQQFSFVWYAWILPSTFGFGLGLYALIWAALRDRYIVFSPPSVPVLEWDPLLGGALLGLALGLCQCFVWRFRIQRMLTWIVANVVGWSLGMFLPQLTAYLLRNSLAVSHTPWLATLFPVAFAAVVTGLVLVLFTGGSDGLD